MNKPENLVVVTFYKFVSFPDYQEKRLPLLSHCKAQNIQGSILLAQEGINGTIAGTRENIDSVIGYLQSDERFRDLQVKESLTETNPFKRLKVKLKKEIVTLGIPEVNPNEKVGNYVPPQEWNDLITNPEVILIDTRNDYEVEIGTFKGAKNPHTQSFREFPEYIKTHLDPQKNQKVAMFCTGGIRCEKATSFLLNEGFKEVYHLQGGILKYLEEIPPQESLWEGECFVFDQRVALTHGVKKGNHEMCLGCGHPITKDDKLSPQYEEGICCPYCYEDLTPQKRMRQEEKMRQLARLKSVNK
jgi:UPF0176 protein